MRKYVPVIGSALAIIVLGVVILALDSSHAVSLSGKFLAVTLGMALAVTLSIVLLAKSWRCVAPFGPYVVFTLALPFISLSPVKSFRIFFETITVGMTEQEVLKQLDVHFPADGRYAKPESRPFLSNSLHFILNPHDGRYDAETVTVIFHEGGVLAKMYASD